MCTNFHGTLFLHVSHEQFQIHMHEFVSILSSICVEVEKATYRSTFVKVKILRITVIVIFSSSQSTVFCCARISLPVMVYSCLHATFDIVNNTDEFKLKWLVQYDRTGAKYENFYWTIFYYSIHFRIIIAKI